MTRPGRFLPVDADGYLLNDTSLDRLPSGWGAVVDAIVAEATAEHGERLHSVWVRGSAVSGQAVPDVSDLDTILLVDEPVTDGSLWLSTAWAPAAEARLSAPGCTGVEVAVASLPALWTDRGAFLRFLLATQAARASGPPLDLPRFAVGPDVCFVAGHVRGALREAAAELPGQTDPDEIRSLTRWLAKTVVRAGLELVLADEGRYARDLWPCYLAFARHVPGRADAMARAVDAAVSPDVDGRDLAFLLEDLGPWLLGRLEGAGLA